MNYIYISSNTPGDLVRRCVSCQHLALQPSWILGICVKVAWTLESTTGVVNKWPRVNVVCMVFVWKLTVDGVIFTRFEEPSPPSCGFCHIPYDELNMPFPTQLTYCYHCRRQKVITILYLAFIFQVKFAQKKVVTSCIYSSKVPDVLFTTIDLPSEAAVTGKGCFIQAR